MAELLEDIPVRALAIYAHPDDADVSCGGTLARWVRAGSEVELVLCTNGDKGTSDPALDPAELTERRRVEADAAAECLGLAGQHRLGHPDGELEDGPGLRGELVRWIREFRPDTVLCPDPTAVFFGEDYYNHRDHRVVGFAALDAVSPAAALPHYFPDAGKAHRVSTVLLSGTLEPSVWVDITAALDAKTAAVACHRSQFTDGGVWARQAVVERAAAEGRLAGVRHAEGFRRLHLDG